jgi:hypothetical protein
MPPKPRGDASIQIWGDDKGVKAMLDVVMEALSPAALVVFMTGVVGPYLAERGEKRFKGEGDDVVGNWEPLSMATQAIRMGGRLAGNWSVGDAHPINQRTGELEDYITQGRGDTITTGLDVVMTYPDQAMVNPELQDKMQTAQQGRTQTPITPARPVLGLNENDLLFVLTSLSVSIQMTGARTFK